MVPVRQHRTNTNSGSIWYKDAIIYQLHVKTFCDGNGDGIGDFKGLIGKLDYLQDMGVTALWLLPFYPSPLKDDGYDIADYKAVHPAYGTLRDFKAFLRDAHRRGLRVITELVVNHTSDEHPWFQRARRSKPGSARRDFYVWSDTPDRYNEARIIFRDFESSNWAWDPVAKAYYWHRFYSHQPDLNYENPLVQKAVLDILDFWFEMGVDGLRLDAVPYLFEREGSNCENLPKTHEFLRRMRTHVDRHFENRMLLAEANQWPEDASAYFGKGDECHMAFHFPLMPRLFMALRMEERFPIVDILEQTPSIPDDCQWATFLRNHDELTLEMVTDEERDYMYHVYAQDQRMRINLGIRRRLAPLMGNDRKRIELMKALLFSLLGTPVIYYGDEIGMGDNVYLGDRDGVRTPMQWSLDRNAGFSTANPQQLYLPVIIDPEYSYETVNVEAQQGNRHSLLWWMKRLISMRKQYEAFGRGQIEFLNPDNCKILAYIRHYNDEHILVVANLSRFVQYVSLDLSSYANAVPVELFGQMDFPPVDTKPYFLTLGPHSFYWFSFDMKRDVPEDVVSDSLLISLPLTTVDGSWNQILRGKSKAELEKRLPVFLQRSRWFRGKARDFKNVSIDNVIPLRKNGSQSCFVLLKVDYKDGTDELYVLPLAYALGEKAEKILKDYPHAVVLRLKLRDEKEEGLLFDALMQEEFNRTLFDTIQCRRHLKGEKGKLTATPTRRLRQLRTSPEALPEPKVLRAEQTNTSVVYGEQFFLKVIRRLDPGINPDLEIGLFLTEQGFPNIPAVAGAVEYSEGREEPLTLAILEEFVPSEGDAWSYTLNMLGHFFERIQARRADFRSVPLLRRSLIERIHTELPSEWMELVGGYHESVRLLGRRTAELHVALASDAGNPRFAPEPFSTLYQRSLYQSMRSLTRNVFRTLERRCGSIEEHLGSEVRRILDMEGEILQRLHSVVNQRLSGQRIRCHGDYHLGQLLYTGKDFIIIDFEGEPAHLISERRIKRSPLRDVAGMLRSFHYAAHAALVDHGTRGFIRVGDSDYFQSWSRVWTAWVSTVFFKSYLEIAAQSRFLPESLEEIQVLLDLYVLEKAIYELGYEMNNRPDWVVIPLEGIRLLLGREE